MLTVLSGAFVSAGPDALKGSALRPAVLAGSMDTTTYRAVGEYVSPVPRFPSGRDAADYGEAGIDAPDETTRRVIKKIIRTRNDLVQ